MSWSEVGTGTLAAVLTSGNYLGTGLTASGATNPGGVGLFVPHHYNVAVSNGCGSQFTYSGQPFGVTVTARNAADTITANHDGTGSLSSVTAIDVSLSAVSNGGTGILSNATVAAAKFVTGTATVAASSTSPTFTFNTKPFVPTTVTLRATDSTNVNGSISSSGYTEGGVSLRSGRIKVSNKFGASGNSLTVPVQTQYWAAVSSNAGAATWVVNDKDSCTVLPTTAVVMGGYYSSTGASTAAWPVTASAFNLKSPGNFELVLTKSNASVTGSVDFAFALGSTSTDQSCLNPARSTSGATTGAGLTWLRAQYGSTYGCAGNSAYNRDPSARATFGVFSPETNKAVHVRDIF
jgi:MSHA biogenesis protein MshQ